MTKKFGFDLLVEQAAELVAMRVSQEAIEWQASPSCGDTPIEKLLYLAIYCHVRFAWQFLGWELVAASSAERLEEAKSRPDFRNIIIVQKQVEIEGVGRVDFLFHAHGDWALEPGAGAVGWRRLIVECDGHDFHERTKEQAAKDRSRDRAAALAGYEVFRFTGSEIWRDPWACADQVVAWANKGI